MYHIYPNHTTQAQEIGTHVINFISAQGNECKISDKPEPGEFVISIGDDRHFLDTFRRVEKNNVFCIGIGKTVLTDITPQNYIKYLNLVFEDKWFIQKKSRITLVGSGKHNNALNDILIFPTKTGSVLRHSVEIDGSEIWTDTSDGIIISTPTGSTAYNLSAGGSVMIADPQVLSVVSVNSIGMQSPVVISDNLAIKIRLTEKTGIVAIFDGLKRIPLHDNQIEIKKAPSANFIRCKHDILVYKQVNKVDVDHLRSKTEGLAPSHKFVFKTLMITGRMTQKELIRSTSLPVRTVRDALITMEKTNIIEKTPYAKDIRQSVYRISK